MKFAIQHNLMNAAQLRQVDGATAKYPRVFVGCIPFSHEITCEEPLDGVNYIPYGSTLFTSIAAERKWKGLHLDLSTMNYRAWCENRDDMLNSGTMPVRDAVEFLRQNPDSRWFTRPSADLKQYSGYVGDANSIADHFESMMGAVGGGSYYMPPDAEVVLSEPQEILAEWRWFIVDRKIVSGSMYRAHGQLRLMEELEPAVVKQAQRFADKWLPHDCVVMDLAYTVDDVKVIEFNCINASGFYRNDIPAVFRELYRYHTK